MLGSYLALALKTTCKMNTKLNIQKGFSIMMEGYVLFNNTLNTFYLRLYGISFFYQVHYIILTLNKYETELNSTLDLLYFVK